MAIKKNKIHLIDIQFLETEMENYYDYIESLDGDCYYYDSYDYSCYCDACMPTYTYLPVEKLLGKMIDMTSFYPKEIKRQINIDYLLGVENEFTKPTIGDLFNR